MKNRNVVIPSPLLISAAVSSFYFIGGFALPRYSPSSRKKQAFTTLLVRPRKMLGRSTRCRAYPE